MNAIMVGRLFQNCRYKIAVCTSQNCDYINSMMNKNNSISHRIDLICITFNLISHKLTWFVTCLTRSPTVEKIYLIISRSIWFVRKSTQLVEKSTWLFIQKIGLIRTWKSLEILDKNR